MKYEEARRGLALLMLPAIAFTVGLHMLGATEAFRVDWSDPVLWLGTASPDEAVAGLLRSIGIAAGYWLIVTTALYSVSSRSKLGVPRLVRLVTLPGVRRVVDRTLSTALAASIAVTPFAPTLADEPPPPAVMFDINTDGIPVPHIRMSAATLQQDSPTVVPPPPEMANSTPISPTLVAPILVNVSAQPVPLPAHHLTEAATHTVEDGDNLWTIADRQVRASTTEATTITVTTYWREVIAANRSTLRSGDPNLIYPGEMISLPALGAAP